MRDATLPTELQGLNGKVQYVQRVSSTEWSSSCPNCGGVIHKGGDFPDRFRMWTNANGKNKVMGWCRHCAYVWFPDTSRPLDPHEIERWRQEQLERERERKRSAEKAIKNLQSERIWETYNFALNDWALNDVIGKEWGIRPDWVNYWQLGLISDFTVYSKDNEPYHSPGISIPVWRMNNTVHNIKVRVLNPKSSGDRYRALYKVGCAAPFVALRDMKFDTCLLVEGEKKAMVSAQCAENIQIIGIPTKTPDETFLTDLESFGKIVVCLDPDASKAEKDSISPLIRIVKMIGTERVAVMELPDKLDDMIVKYKFPLMKGLKYAKKMEA
jgi:hypothetical protein